MRKKNQKPDQQKRETSEPSTTRVVPSSGSCWVLQGVTPTVDIHLRNLTEEQCKINIMRTTSALLVTGRIVTLQIKLWTAQQSLTPVITATDQDAISENCAIGIAWPSKFSTDISATYVRHLYAISATSPTS
ncbi:hypothetical protein B0H10DRAFT_1951954 [Mycena sp. CBHHK59/15]|nr:hypothetical protein B0H10DRAFT_1951954 [Mycena sp. CBHHK59/15]